MEESLDVPPSMSISLDDIDKLEASFSLSAKDGGDFDNDIGCSFQEINQTKSVYPSEIMLTTPGVHDDETITAASINSDQIRDVVHTCINDMLIKLCVSPCKVVFDGMSPKMS